MKNAVYNLLMQNYGTKVEGIVVKTEKQKYVMKDGIRIKKFKKVLVSDVFYAPMTNEQLLEVMVD